MANCKEPLHVDTEGESREQRSETQSTISNKAQQLKITFLRDRHKSIKDLVFFYFGVFYSQNFISH